MLILCGKKGKFADMILLKIWDEITLTCQDGFPILSLVSLTDEIFLPGLWHIYL